MITLNFSQFCLFYSVFHYVFASKLSDDELMRSILEDSPTSQEFKRLHFERKYDHDNLWQSKEASESSFVEKDIPDDNEIIFEIQINKPLPRTEIVNRIRKAVSQHLKLPPESIQVSKYDHSTGKLKMYFLYSKQKNNDTDVLELRPADEIIGHIDKKQFENVGEAISVLNVKSGQETESDFSAGKKIHVQNLFSDKNFEAWKWAFHISGALAFLFSGLLTLFFLSRCIVIKIIKEVPIEEPKHVVVQPILCPAVSDVGIIQPENLDRHITETDSEPTLSPARSPMRIKGKGLLERRGSNASLTLDLNRSQENIHCGTPPKECSTEEYLQSSGKKMNRRQLRSCLRDVKALHSEFWDIPMNHPEKVEVAGSGTKNRYKTILPNESTRVHLYERNGDPLSSYINANYIRGYSGEVNAYIATQGPMPHTVDDFWQMVWKEHSPLIVMITKLKEKMKVKCEPYIPDYQHQYDDIEVTVTRVIPRDGFTIRELVLRRGNETHKLHHFWYTSWPDHKTPDTAKQLISMALEVEALRHDSSGIAKGPTIVHCSAGIGRTGCFIAASIGIRQLLEENMIDVLGIVCSLRLDRGGMIQTAEQYEFVHQALGIFESTLPDSAGE